MTEIANFEQKKDGAPFRGERRLEINRSHLSCFQQEEESMPIYGNL